MLTTKHNWFILTLVSVMSLLILLSQSTVFAQWQGPPENPPEGNIELNFLENPMTEDLDLAGYNVMDVGTLTTDQLVVATGTLDITSPLANSGEEKWAFGAIAGKNFAADGYTYGLHSKTIGNSSGNPSYAVYGISNNTGGVGVLGLGNAGWAGYFQGNFGVTGDSYFAGDVDISSGHLSIPEGYAWVENVGPKTAVMAIAEYGENSAGLKAYGNIGVFAAGETLGLYAYGYYGTVTQAATISSYIPPDDPDDPVVPPVDDEEIISLFGINSVLADVSTYDAYTVGLVSTGGFNGGGILAAAGLGLCAISGANAFDLNQADDQDYYSYCQDTNGKNNYAGFFAGDVYIRDGDLHTESGSMQLSDNLPQGSQNLIYGNATSAINGSHLIKLQYIGADKFKVDRNGAGVFAGGLTASSLTLDRGSLFLEKSSSYIDFAGGGIEGPECKLGSEGIVYYFSNYNALCVCRGSSNWANLIPGEPNGKCTNGEYNDP